MGWDVEDPGLTVVFDRAIPPFVEEQLAQAVDEMCAKMGVDARRYRSPVLPPGRRQGDRRDRKRAHLNQGELNLEREVLHDYGNMSAPTVMFVLERLLQQGLPDRVLMTAFGPGFTCAGLMLEAA